MLAWSLAGAIVWAAWSWMAGLALVIFGLWLAAERALPAVMRRGASWTINLAAIALVLMVLSRRWLPLGPEPGLATNALFAGAVIGCVLLVFWLFRLAYPSLLEWCLAHKLLYLCVPASLLALGTCVWIGFEDVFRWLPAANARLGGDEDFVLQRTFWKRGAEAFPGLGKEFMPPLDEGSFLLMPITMPHASLGEAHDVLRMQDAAIAAIPEVSQVVGKIGRVESPLDPAPISMVETVVNYYPEYLVDEAGRRRRFRFDEAAGEFARDDRGDLIPEGGGRPFRLWRDEIRTPDDIWEEIVAASVIPGSTVAPKLQPIATRLVMLQSGMRAPMGVKVFGPDLETIERVGLDIERLLKQVPGVEESAVIADRVLGKPYLEIELDRDALARYGLHIRDVQDVIEVAIGGRRVTTTVEGRERYPVRVRYPRELRDRIDTLGRILVPAPGGAQIPLEQLAELRFTPGPQAIKSEDTFLTSYVIFDKQPELAEVDVVEACQRHLSAAIDSGELVLPPGVSYRFAGTYENQLHAQRTLAVVLPVALGLIFLVLYLQFSRVSTTAMVFAGILVAWSGGFTMLWLYGQPWFLDTTFRGVPLRELFQVNPVNLSVAIWVGFLALFGIASDDGVLIATYLDQSFARRNPTTVAEVRMAVVAAARRRVRPALMTTATTVLALLPVLTSRGRGADIMIPMAIPTFGGMVFAILSVFLVPVLYCSVAELRLRMEGAPGR
jgi:Cu(I)/Ag(I) efflux system membrane protein CusA/SilA